MWQVPGAADAGPGRRKEKAGLWIGRNVAGIMAAVGRGKDGFSSPVAVAVGSDALAPWKRARNAGKAVIFPIFLLRRL